MVTVVNDGLEYLARYVAQVTVGSFKWIANGSGSTAEGNAQTALVSENTLYDFARMEATCLYEADYKTVWQATLTANGGIVTVREIAIFNQLAVGGKMLLRHVLGADKVVNDDESIQITVKLTQAR
jgi:hypothetical protein